MGYHSHLHGKITITPPLPWPQYRSSDFCPGRGSPTDHGLALSERVETEQTSQGETTVRQATGVVARFEDARTFYAIKEELAALTEAYPGHSFDGYLVRTGHDQGDVERYWVDGTSVVQSERARLVWPDGSDVESPSAFG